jgi:predicted  nucleic acid-binding Zn-ribbon protein
VLVKQNGKMSSEKAPPMRIVTPESDSGRPSPPPKIKDSRMSMVIQGAQPHGSGSPDFSREGGNSSEVMERIFHQIHKAKIELPSINFKTEINRPFLLSDFEMALRDVLGSYEYLYRLWNDSKDTVAELEERYEALEAKYHDDLAQNSKAFEERILSMERESERKNIFLEGKMSNMKEEQETWKNKHDEWVARIQEDHKSEKDALIERYEIKIQKLNGVINLAKSKQDSEKKGLQQQHEDMMAKAKEELTRIKKDSESQVSRAQESLADTVKHCALELEKLRSQHRKEKQLIATDSDIERTRLFQELNDEKERWKREYQKERREMAAALDQAEDDLQKEREEKANEIRLLKSEHEAEKAEIKAAHGEDKAKYARGLQKTVENLQAALSNRDHFKAMSDHEFAYHFQDICTEVDEFARVSWEKEQASSWPFRDEMLRKSGNERRTKQYIIQNTLWVILYEKILCTPFRVLGSEGEVHQSKWIEKFGQGEVLHENARHYD